MNLAAFLIILLFLKEKLFQINQFWLPEMYLRLRLPIPVNSNPVYVFPQKQFADVNEQLK